MIPGQKREPRPNAQIYFYVYAPIAFNNDTADAESIKKKTRQRLIYY